MQRIVLKIHKNSDFYLVFTFICPYMQHLPRVAIHRYAYYCFLRINRDFCPNVIEIEYFGNYERFWILC